MSDDLRTALGRLMPFAFNGEAGDQPCDICGQLPEHGHDGLALCAAVLAACAALTATPTPAPTLDVRDCECVPGHRCDCHDLRSLLWRILTSAEYGKMEAEGLAADTLGLTWSETEDRFVGPDALAARLTAEAEGAQG